MMSRIALAVITAWALGVSGTSLDTFAQRGHRIESLCQNTWVPACVERLSEKRQAFIAGLARAGFDDLEVDSEELFLSVIEAEARYGVNHQLLVAMAVAESSISTSAVSPQGALGILQMLPDTAFFLWPDFLTTLEPEDALLLKDPVLDSENLRLSVLMAGFYMSKLQERFKGNESLALASYNVGPAKLSRALREGGMLGASYVRRVREILRNFEGPTLETRTDNGRQSVLKTST